MHPTEPFVDIHCHILPGIDDGARSWDEAHEMATIAATSGTRTVIATPHQGGAFAHNSAALIRSLVVEFQQQLDDLRVPLRVLPGADVRWQSDLPRALAAGEILTLADHRRHLLLDLPHERYVPFDHLLAVLRREGIDVILSHPERNQGLLKKRELVERLVDNGCLMQVTSGSLLGTFGPTCQDLAVWMLSQGFVHTIATDAHGRHSRRPLLKRVHERLVELVGRDEALALCCQNPARIAAGEPIPAGRRPIRMQQNLARWMRWKPAA
jgi:protein-tyrosine phosphatase